MVDNAIAVTTSPRSVCMGFAYYLNGQIEEAIEKFKSAINMQKNESRQYFNLAMCYLLQDNLIDATQTYREGIKVDKMSKETEISNHRKDIEDALLDHPEWKAKLQPALEILNKCR